MKKKRLFISLALTVFGLVTVGNFLVTPKAAAIEQGTWLDSNSISFNGSEYLKSVKDAGTSYVKQGSSDLCNQSDQYASNDHDKYQGDLNKEIWVIRDIKDGNKKANHIKYKVVIYKGGSVVAPEEVEVSNGKLVFAQYGCQEINKFPIELTEPQLKNADYRWINQEKIQDVKNGKVYTRVNETTYEWKEDPGNCHEKIVVSADKKSGTLFHNGGEPTAAGGCSDSGYDKRSVTIGRLELSDDPPGSNEELIGQLSPDDESPESEPSCESEGGEMSWILCPVLRYTSSFLQRVDEQLNHLLQVPNKYFEGDSAEKLKNSWGRLRDIAFIALIPIMLVMVIGTALGFELVSAYTVKKALPRLVIAVIFMSLSFEICRFLIVLTNDVGRGLLGLLTSSFTGEQEITLAQLFDPGGGSGFVATFILAGTGALALGAMGIVLSYGLLIGVTLLIAFLLLALRQMLLVTLIVLAPVAILSWIFPGNDKLWKLWWGSFSKLLLLYPLVMLLIGAGRAFAFMVQSAEDGGMLETILILTAYVGPYFFIPAAFKFAGGVFGNIAGMANDRSRGLLDRQKKWRQGQYSKKWQDLKGNDYYKHGPGKSRLNSVLAGTATGPRGNFGLGGKGQQATARAASIHAAQSAKDDLKLQDLAQSSDEGIAIMALSGGTAAGAQAARAQLQASWQRQRLAQHQAAVAAGTMTQQQAQDEALNYATLRGENGYNAAAAVGFSGTRARGALTLMGQNKSRAIGPGEMGLVQDGMDRLAGSNPVERRNLEDGYQFNSRSAGRFDLGAGSALEGFNRTSLYQAANGHQNSITGAGQDALARVDRGEAGAMDDAVILRHELASMLPNTTGDVRNAVVAQMAALDQSQPLRNYMDTQVIAPGGGPVVRQQRVTYNPANPAHTPLTLQNPTGWTADDIARGWRTEQRNQTMGDVLQERARTHQREDPDILAQQQQQSDRRLKRNIQQVSILNDGITLYSFQYLWSTQVYIGVMAQDLLESHPEAVYVDSNGFYGVYYAKLGLKMMTIEEWEAQQSISTNKQ